MYTCKVHFDHEYNYISNIIFFVYDKSYYNIIVCTNFVKIITVGFRESCLISVEDNYSYKMRIAKYIMQTIKFDDNTIKINRDIKLKN